MARRDRSNSQNSLGGRRYSSAGLLLVTVSALALMHGNNAYAACAAKAVTARGEPASYRWLAILKARGNWRARVRSDPRLGPAYDGWSAARNPEVRCITSPGSIVCTVSATPCQQ